MIDLATRTRNWGRGNRTVCSNCLNDGVLDVAWEHQQLTSGQRPTRSYDVEVSGPCPKCERGLRTEFGIGKDNQPSLDPPWGRDGYWATRAAA